MSDMITAEAAAKLLDGTTPGPWKVCETTIHGRKYGGCWVEGPDVDDGDGRPQGLLIPITGSGGSMSYTTRLVDIQGHDHNDANAHLIAAAPDLARTVIALHAQLADAKAAQAMVVERAAEVPRQHAKHLQRNGLTAMSSDFDSIETDIRALADTDGLALVQALRVERDELRAAVEGLIAVLDRNEKKGPIPDFEMVFCWLAAQDVRAAFRKIAPKGLVVGHVAAAADRDRLAAANAALETKLKRMVRERDDALTFLDNAVSQAPEPLRELGQWLSKTLDEDTWPTAERFLNAAVKSCAALAEVQADARREGGE